MSSDADLGSVPEFDRLYGIFGGSIARSLSPRIHNGAYRAHGLSAHYLTIQTSSADVPALANTLEEHTDRLAGLTVVSPHKERALELANEIEDIAGRCGAANMMVRCPAGWRAETTDALGVLEPLRRRGVSPRGRRAIVVGCGGAGRAAAVGLRDAGAEVTLANRHAERGQFAAELLELPWVTLDRIDVRGCDLIVNATPLGQEREAPPYSLAALPVGAIVVDFVYAKRHVTPLAAAARAAGHEVIDGREILIIQVAAQYERMTGVALDEALAWELAGFPDSSAQLGRAEQAVS